jgi:predicted ATP-grasp superfamily ATP-dependent carboligase
MQQHILVVGFSTRHVVQSAFKAGYVTYAVDHFCDQDLFWYTRDRMRFEELDEIPECVRVLCERYPVDFIVVTSGAEQLQSRIPRLGTPPDRLGRFLDKQEMHRFFEEQGIPSPSLMAEGTFPVMAKPTRGAGGWRNRILRNNEEKEAWLREFPDIPVIYQNIVEGIPASVSCISDGKRAVAIAANEQLLRETEGTPYGYAGSVTPISHPFREAMLLLAEKAVAASGCTGSVGVDFILSDRVWAIEINPRFQATLDTVEMATGTNLFRLHAQACIGGIPKQRPETRRHAARAILFAERDFTLSADLSRFAPTVADIPWPGTSFEEGNALVSVFGYGSTRDAAEKMLNINIASIRRYIQQ